MALEEKTMTISSMSYKTIKRTDLLGNLPSKKQVVDGSNFAYLVGRYSLKDRRDQDMKTLRSPISSGLSAMKKVEETRLVVIIWWIA